jgi:hypothetical protein
LFAYPAIFESLAFSMNDPPAIAADPSEGRSDSKHRGRDSVVRAGRCLLYFGLAVLALQALSDAALAWWCVAREGCKLLTEPSTYPYFFGILSMCIGAGMIALAPIVDAIAKIFDRPAAPGEAANLAGRCLLYFGLAVLALQALSEAALAWCVARQGCRLLSAPSIYPYFFGILSMCIGAGLVALAPIVAAIEKIFDKPAGAEEAANPTPTIAEFYGIKAQMSYEDAGSPIVRICCGPSTASVRLADGEKVSGDELPPVAAQIVRQWISIRSRELHENWQRARAREPLKTIPGPDDA